ncbi:tyrosinase family oxidase copper chaperone [Streptomyces sp. NPDC005840]|uniref:tyrosinase family oxidase copper chaperone n=1 Tax=Streptomyces sp. NPDC005840 TaxID=3157072 RepID=UPI0033FDB745
MGVGVTVGEEPVDAEPGPAPGRTAGARSRRGVLRGLLASAVALVCAPLVTASRPKDTADRDGAFDETYRGRRLRGSRVTAHAPARAGARSRAVPARAEMRGRAVPAQEHLWRVTVDGSPLHLMRRADGGWLSMIDHYRSYPTPLAAARAAVDELGPHRRPRDPVRGRMCGQDRTEGGSGRGVHA